MRRLTSTAVLVLLAALGFMTHANAADYQWIGTTGYVDDVNNWDLGAVPGAGDGAIIQNDGTAQIDASHLFGGTLGYMNVGTTTGVGNVSQTAGDVAMSGSLFIGDATTGLSTYNLDAGTVAANGWSAVGNGTTGTMTIGQTGNSATASYYCNANQFVGFSTGGNGTVTMAGEAYASTGNGIMIGRNYSGGTCSGTLTMKDNAELVSPNAVRGNGNLTFNVGYGAGSTGSMSMSGNTSATIANWDAFIGLNGATGTLSMTDNAQMSITTIRQTEGENTYNGLAQVGLGYGGTAGSQGTINLSGNASLAYNTALSVLLGAWGNNSATASTANVNISGGTDLVTDPGASLSSTNTMTFGVGTNGQANLKIHEYGSLTVAADRGIDIAAYLGKTDALIDGHGNLSSGYINLGSQYGSNGKLTLRDNATVNVTNGPGGYTMNVGTWQGHGELVVEDNAAVTVNGSLMIGNQGDANSGTISTGTLTMSGGTINANNIYMGVNGYGSATVTMTGGSMTSAGATALARGSGANVSATMTMSGNASWSSTYSWLAVGNGYGGGGYGEAWLSDNATISSGGDILVAYGGIGTLHAGDGTAADNVVVHAGTGILLGAGSADANATINLNAGATVETPKIYTSGAVSSVFNFNGGLLKVTADDTPETPFFSNNGGATAFAINVLGPGARIDTNGYDATITEGLLAGDAAGGGLTKTGDGTLTLGGANTYTGDTSVAAGALSVLGSLTSNVDVGDAAALMGTGSIDGNVTVAGGLAPGASIGTLTVTGDLSLTGTLDVEFDSDAGTIDQLIVSGNLDLTGATLSFSDLGTSELAPGAYVFASYGTLAGDPAIEVGLPANCSVVYQYGGNNIALVAVPEPSMLALLAVMAMAAAGCRVRR